ncbi:hypothetical protein AMELA_G00241120 [Ameiurus melas]|uniref:Uncharacterized protein n=1 Tax=Ameiurus melas TaxID=219545 RepID=A0A7J5ZW17_AMEME|nr:hypothetical protein AMELA_G00241120 [Ameiurus melas]
MNSSEKGRCCFGHSQLFITWVYFTRFRPHISKEGIVTSESFIQPTSYAVAHWMDGWMDGWMDIS